MHRSMNIQHHQKIVLFAYFLREKIKKIHEIEANEKILYFSKMEIELPP